VRARGRESKAKKQIWKHRNRGAGPRSLVSQTESCEVKRSPGSVGPDAQREDVGIVAGA
jgi:hypothetical protein